MMSPLSEIRVGDRCRYHDDRGNVFFVEVVSTLQRKLEGQTITVLRLRRGPSIASSPFGSAVAPGAEFDLGVSHAASAATTYQGWHLFKEVPDNSPMRPCYRGD